MKSDVWDSIPCVLTSFFPWHALKFLSWCAGSAFPAASFTRYQLQGGCLLVPVGPRCCFSLEYQRVIFPIRPRVGARLSRGRGGGGCVSTQQKDILGVPLSDNRDRGTTCVTFVVLHQRLPTASAFQPAPRLISPCYHLRDDHPSVDAGGPRRRYSAPSQLGRGCVAAHNGFCNLCVAATSASPGAGAPWKPFRFWQLAIMRWPCVLLAAAFAVLALIRLHGGHEQARFTHEVMVRMEHPPLHPPRCANDSEASKTPLTFETRFTAVSRT